MKKIFEIEKICVGTNTMSEKSYLKCRNYNFILQLLAHPIFRPVYKLIKKLGVSWYDFSRLVADTIQDDNFKGKLKDLYNEFCKESHSELFDTQEEAIKYYSIPKNYKSLLNGDVGENLLAKYTSKGVLIYDDIITSIFYIIKNQLSIKHHSELNSILNSSEKWLKNLYLIDEIFGDDKNVEKNTKYQLDMEFDFPSWLSKSHLPFDQFKNHSIYEMNYDIKKINHLRDEIRFSRDQSDNERSANRLWMSLSNGSEIIEKNFSKINLKAENLS